MGWEIDVKVRPEGQRWFQKWKATITTIKVGEQYLPVNSSLNYPPHSLLNTATELILKPYRKDRSTCKKFYLRKLNEQWWFVEEKDGKILAAATAEVRFMGEPKPVKRKSGYKDERVEL